MGKFKNGMDVFGGVLDIVNSAYGTVDKGVKTVDQIKSGNLNINFCRTRELEKKIRHMKQKFYILWVFMIVITVLFCIFF